MLGFLIPKESYFLTLVANAAQNAYHAVETFQKLMREWKKGSPHFERLRELETEGDMLTHEIIDKLNRTFVTPIDREDIHGIAVEIDDICDILQALGDRMQLYELGDEMPPGMVAMADLLEENGKAVLAAVREVRNFRRTSRVRDHCIQIKRIENEADDLLKHELAALFKMSDTMYVLKWKEIFETIEAAHDKCADIANTLEGIVVKNA